MNRNSNPVFRNIDKNVSGDGYYAAASGTATWKGIISKTAFLVLLTIASGIASWFIPLAILYVILAIGGIGAFICVLIAMRNVKAAKVSSIIYSVLQGITYGAITGIIDSMLPGVGIAALSGTFVIVGVMAFLHSIGSVRATPRLIRFVLGSLVSIFVASLVFFVIGLINSEFLATFGDNYPLMIIITAFMIILGALMLIIDFDNAKHVVESSAPAVYEWQVSLGLMVTMVWIYLQVLRFAILIASRDR